MAVKADSIKPILCAIDRVERESRGTFNMTQRPYFEPDHKDH